jgi:diaminohydroxyphosphoribosylaminopyrimidine deaminase/5-amino-6-(5-phosphoribosylamino)uracil reductase
MANGESKWITSAAARRDVQHLRAGHSAILTGVGTLIADDPRLDVRLAAAELAGTDADAPVRQPLRVVVDSHWRTPPDARLLAPPGAVLIVGTVGAPARQAQLEALGAQTLCRPGLDGRVDLPALMDELGRRELNELLVEAGPTLAGALLAAGLIDEILVYLAPHLMGDAGRGLFHLPALASMSDRVRLEIEDVRPVGCDWRITARPAGRLTPPEG